MTEIDTGCYLLKADSEGVTFLWKEKQLESVHDIVGLLSICEGWHFDMGASVYSKK